MYEYAKVILYAYPKLDAIADAVEQSAKNKAALSYRAPADTLTVAEKIAEEMALAGRIRALSRLVTEMLGGFGEEERFLLEYKYFRRRDILQKRVGVLSCSERSYYRRQEEILKRICLYFAAKGICADTFIGLYGDFPCFKKLHRALCAGRERTIAKKRGESGIAFQKSLRSSAVCPVFFPRATKTATATAAAEATQMTTICTAEIPPVSSSAVTGGGSGSAEGR